MLARFGPIKLAVAERVRAELAGGRVGGPYSHTALEPAQELVFYRAEEYHQKWYAKKRS